MDMAHRDKDNKMIDCKDAKAIVCADISPTHFTGKSWSSATYPDHTWDQSFDNAVKPMTHLFLTTKVDEQVFDVGGAALLQVTRTGKAVTLVNLSLFKSLKLHSTV